MRTVAPLKNPLTPSVYKIDLASSIADVLVVQKVIRLVFNTSIGVVKKPAVLPAIAPLIEFAYAGIVT